MNVPVQHTPTLAPRWLLTDARRVAFQHGQLRPRSGVPDLHETLVCADSHQVPLGWQHGRCQAQMGPSPPPFLQSLLTHVP